MTVSPNAAVTATEDCWRHCAAGDEDAAGALMRPDFVHDDRRAGMANTISDRANDSAGLRRRCVSFDSDDFDAALAEFDASAS